MYVRLPPPGVVLRRSLQRESCRRLMCALRPFWACAFGSGDPRHPAILSLGNSLCVQDFGDDGRIETAAFRALPSQLFEQVQLHGVGHLGRGRAVLLHAAHRKGTDAADFSERVVAEAGAGAGLVERRAQVFHGALEGQDVLGQGVGLIAHFVAQTLTFDLAGDGTAPADLPSGTLTQMQLYLDLLLRWNARMNL